MEADARLPTPAHGNRVPTETIAHTATNVTAAVDAKETPSTAATTQAPVVPTSRATEPAPVTSLIQVRAPGAPTTSAVRTVHHATEAAAALAAPSTAAAV